MATLQGQKIVVIGGSSGIGLAVAKTSLLSSAEHVLIASSSLEKVNSAVARMRADPQLQTALGPSLHSRIAGELLDLKDTAAVRALFDRIGEIDHLVVTSGSIPALFPFRDGDLDTFRDAFDVRFWGTAVAAQKAKIRPGGSITFTIGTALHKPHASWSLIVSAIGAVDALTRSLAIELAPVRVNVVCPGAVDTEIWDGLPKEARAKALDDIAQKLPLKHVAAPEELAEAYLFLMKCNYITGQRIVVDGGDQII